MASIYVVSAIHSFGDGESIEKEFKTLELAREFFAKEEEHATLVEDDGNEIYILASK